MLTEQQVLKALLVQMVLTEQQAHRDRQERKALQEMMDWMALKVRQDQQAHKDQQAYKAWQGMTGPQAPPDRKAQQVQTVLME